MDQRQDEGHFHGGERRGQGLQSLREDPHRLLRQQEAAGEHRRGGARAGDYFPRAEEGGGGQAAGDASALRGAGQGPGAAGEEPGGIRQRHLLPEVM